MKHIVHIIRILFFALFLFLLANGKAMLWLLLFGASLVAALIFGRVYCGYICPMNTLMIPTEKLSKKLSLQTENTPKWLRNGYFSWVALGASIVAVLLLRKLLHTNLPILPIWLLLSAMVTLRYKPAVFHNLICPFGVVQKTFGRFTRRSEQVDQDACIGCRLCEKVCPSDAILVSSENNKAVINPAFCFQCTNCRQACPTNAIHYGKSLTCSISRTVS